MKNLHLTNLILILSLLLLAGLACKPSADGGAKHSSSDAAPAPRSEKNTKLDEYTIKGFRFVYFKIPPGLDRAALIRTAQKFHDSEPDAQLLLVDDDTQLKDYIAYAKAASGQGDVETTELPKEWADKHIIANVQKYISGKFVLCEGNGYNEIAELE
jgi:hypothetical protein